MPFTEIADRVWVAHQEWFALNVGLVVGRDGVVVVDTHGSGTAARTLVDDVRALGVGDVTAVVNTHEHFDHTFGNATFRDAFGAALPIHATEEAAARTVASGDRSKAAYDADPDDTHRAEVLATEVVAADQTISGVGALDLGDRVVELVHPGRGHTAGDLVVGVPDAGVLFTGDLVEESGPPAYGPDCHPLEWPAALDLVLGLLTPDSIVVPGHGSVVDQAFVGAQHGDVGAVAQTIQDLAGNGVPAERALAEGEWPFPRDHLAEAVRRGYGQLRRDQKRLPLA
ncbi:MBL fold metallo-hydrolase [Nocardioides panacisoli]|uniref:MBL fold metallo-hydrolase n=1 Tax=Nocardioides panacisoli TaxID=627624 RepID=UPI001C63139F|nr:MBL fold metallo-hydrolase [Nocardioides panacisoli]QYJ04649.1 MBL fold metallo-hydrolase [Nocardioides panacisoli]